jgi:3-dehydroquinate synthase
MEELYQKALEWGVDRRTIVLALGGGVVGDTAGFLAATLLRGLPWIQLPTTLLAQVDSSVGGKVGINHPLGKNMIGAFHQPALVLAELKTLKTLPARELRAGMAEVVKYGVIADADFFVWLEDKGERMVQLEDWELVEQAVAVSCAIKSRVVGQDEREAGLRAILNFGHTVGHGIEMAAGYGRFRHGEAVSIGMVVAAEIARLMGLAPSPVRSRLESLLSRLGLPYQPPSDLDFEVIQQAIQRDKKNQAGSITMVLPVELGQVQCVKPVRPEVIGQAWKDLLASG